MCDKVEAEEWEKAERMELPSSPRRTTAFGIQFRGGIRNPAWLVRMAVRISYPASPFTHIHLIHTLHLITLVDTIRAILVHRYHSSCNSQEKCVRSSRTARMSRGSHS